MSLAKIITGVDKVVNKQIKSSFFDEDDKLKTIKSFYSKEKKIKLNESDNNTKKENQTLTEQVNKLKQLAERQNKTQIEQQKQINNMKSQISFVNADVEDNI